MRKSRFLPFYFMYVVLMLALIAGGLVFLWQYLEAYELSLPTGVVANYEQTRLHSDYRKALEAYGTEYGTELEPAEEVTAWLDAQLDESGLKLKRGTDLEYSIRLGGQSIGTLYLTTDGVQKYGFGVCRVDHAEWFLPTEVDRSWAVTAPAGAVVEVNGVELTAENSQKKETQIRNDLLPEDMDPMYETEYTFRCFEEPEVAVRPGTDAVYTLEAVDESSWKVSAQCTDAAADAVRPFVEDFVQKYVAYTAARLNVYKLMPYLVEGSVLEKHVQEAVNTMVYVRTGKTEVSNLVVDHFEPCGDAVICQAHYKITDYRKSVFDMNMQLLVVSRNGEYKVLNMLMF